METTFITIHDLSPDARILYASDSIFDILGYTPDEVLQRSCWDFFHPEELPLAQTLHSRGIKLDKAAVLSYCSLKNKQRQWVCCECCFTIVYDVMVCCTSVYRRGMTSQKRAVEAPIVRRLFSSSPEDPRYHMLSHLSGKFCQQPKEPSHEPRAALFLNRFTRTLTIMYATAGIEQVVGISGEEMRGKSFYYCIKENCLDDAVRCLESAKGNNSIAYLRFWFRDPRIADPPVEDTTDTETDTDVSMTDVTSDDISTEDGRSNIRLRGLSKSTASELEEKSASQPLPPSVSARLNGGGLAETNTESTSISAPAPPPVATAASEDPNSRTSSTDSSNTQSIPPGQTTAGIFGTHDQPSKSSSDRSSPPTTPNSDVSGPFDIFRGPVELEAVVSCASDGLVVCLRRARPVVPTTVHQPAVHQPTHSSGVFAAPWAAEPIFHPSRPGYTYYPMQPYSAPGADRAQARLGPAYVPRPHGPSAEDLFSSIRDVAIFAWALTGINGSLAEYARNPEQAKGESQPPSGLHVWDGAGKAYGSDFSGVTSFHNIQRNNMGDGNAHATEKAMRGVNLLPRTKPFSPPTSGDTPGNPR